MSIANNGAADKISILGAGAWGTAVAYCAQKSGIGVKVWARREASFKHFICEFIWKTTDLKEAINWSDAVVIAVPAQSVRDVLMAVKEVVCGSEYWKKKKELPAFIFASKGIELSTGFFMSEVAVEVFGAGVVAGAIGGPNLASEIMDRNPAGISVASCSDMVAEKLMRCFKCGEILSERIGCCFALEIFSSMKNPMAIGYGLLMQYTSSKNALASFLSVAAREISDFALACGVSSEKCTEAAMSFAGIGDLILTATSEKSRNSSFGRNFRFNDNGASDSASLVEGRLSVFAAVKRADQYGIAIPITRSVASVLEGKISIEQFAKKVFEKD
ncbi:NAD(P)H-dependent glycerol-3-phosphate dehydrogenase [Candidatus Hydrogenosomobacter endosymbioticus]|uniref:Glycerol-3-phosphate dehydrogenase n=1 Tax=Candidatus Hydrogenosomobacter endosymbioticus TaxID=2558174 RepID=A0ABM7V8J3_9PROT|nr:NAD(P)H-dependent glycerol-3-phosphate dehydrogenase [Candidatus Hydrogenosomobacter endosymbioticus]BDB96092.1 glycerol-3-phosphate dehydrogenase [NAD(P)+] [Candidatus Hydrogenosomobacter endosymbioticus]